MTPHHPESSRPPSIWPPWNPENGRPGTETLLVAHAQKGRRSIREGMWGMPAK